MSLLTKPTLIKRQALVTCKRIRAQKFNRVSQDFLEQVEADFDAWIRKELHAAGERLDNFLPATQSLITAKTRERLLELANKKLSAIIHSRVQAHPSIGKTLKG